MISFSSASSLFSATIQALLKQLLFPPLTSAFPDPLFSPGRRTHGQAQPRGAGGPGRAQLRSARGAGQRARGTRRAGETRPSARPARLRLGRDDEMTLRSRLRGQRPQHRENNGWTCHLIRYCWLRP